MKKVFLVEMSSKGDWEINTGHFLVVAESKEQVPDIINNNQDKLWLEKEIIGINELSVFIGDNEITTIIHSQEM